ISVPCIQDIKVRMEAMWPPPIMPPIIWPESSPIICARTSGAPAAHVAARANAQAAAIRLSLGFGFGLISTRNRHQPDSRSMTPSRRLTFASGLIRVRNPSGKGGSGSETLSSGVRTQVQQAPDLLEAQSPPPKAKIE